MAFERSQFVKSLRKVKNAVDYQMQQVYFQSKAQAKSLALQAFNKMEKAIQQEIKALMGKYNDLRVHKKWLFDEN
jgi:hypothetical protein